MCNPLFSRALTVLSVVDQLKWPGWASILFQSTITRAQLTFAVLRAWMSVGVQSQLFIP
jgi:hypothetical protein